MYKKHLTLIKIFFLLSCFFQSRALSNDIIDNIKLLIENKFPPNELGYYTDISKFKNKYLLQLYPKKLLLFDSEFKLIEEITNLNFDTTFKNYYIKLASFDLDGNILVFFEGKGLFRYISKNNYVDMSSGNWLENTSVLAICPPSNTSQYIITSIGIAKYDGNNFQIDTISFKRYSGIVDHFPHYNDFAYSIFGDNILYKSLSGKLILYDGRIKHILSPNEIDKIYNKFTYINLQSDSILGLVTDGKDYIYFEYDANDSNSPVFEKKYFSEVIDKWDSLGKTCFPVYFLKDDKNTFWVHLRNKSNLDNNSIIYKANNNCQELDFKDRFSLKSNFCTFLKKVDNEICISIFDAPNYSSKLFVYNKYNGIYPDIFNLKFNIFPNPAHSSSRISLLQEGEISISAVDVLGRSFPLWSGFAAVGEMELDVSPLPTGTYTLLINYGTKVEAVKLIKN